MHLKNATFVLLLGILFLGFQSCTSEKSEASDNAVTESPEAEGQLVKQEIAPPFNNIDVPFQKFTCQPNQAQKLEMDNGSTIEIPANAFVDKNGDPVQVPVEVRYREFHDAAHLIASGIPMSVVSENGEKEWMQTAGMFEIGASSEGEEVFVAEGKDLNVAMASYVEGEYDFWYLDPETNNWGQQGAAGAQPNPGKQAAQTVFNEVQASAARKPLPPRAYNKKKPALNFDINYSLFPELKEMKGIIWQYAGKDTDKDPANNSWIYSTNWQEIDLKPTRKEGQYQLKLASGEKEYAIPVFACQKGADLEQAKAAYQEKLKEYREVQKILQEKEKLAKQQADFIRSFRVQNFGIYNYDLILKMKDPVKLLADFEFDGVPEQIKRMVTICLITGKGRAVVKFPYHQWDRFGFDPTVDNRMVAILPGNKIATFSQQDFKDQLEKIKNADGKTYLFRMTVKDQPVQTMADVRDQVDVLM